MSTALTIMFALIGTAIGLPLGTAAYRAWQAYGPGATRACGVRLYEIGLTYYAVVAGRKYRAEWTPCAPNWSDANSKPPSDEDAVALDTALRLRRAGW